MSKIIGSYNLMILSFEPSELDSTRTAFKFEIKATAGLIIR